MSQMKYHLTTLQVKLKQMRHEILFTLMGLSAKRKTYHLFDCYTVYHIVPTFLLNFNITFEKQLKLFKAMNKAL